MDNARITSSVLVVAILLFGGCRTYGDYGSTDKTIAQIAETNQAFARALDRARVDAAALRSAAVSNAALAPMADRYDSVVADHGRLVEEHARTAADLGGLFFAYSAANRLLGSIVTEQRIIAQRYADVTVEVATELGVPPAIEPRPVSTYEFVPPYYEEVRYKLVSPSIDALLRQAGF